MSSEHANEGAAMASQTLSDSGFRPLPPKPGAPDTAVVSEMGVEAPVPVTRRSGSRSSSSSSVSSASSSDSYSDSRTNDSHRPRRRSLSPSSYSHTSRSYTSRSRSKSTHTSTSYTTTATSTHASTYTSFASRGGAANETESMAPIPPPGVDAAAYLEPDLREAMKQEVAKRPTTATMMGGGVYHVEEPVAPHTRGGTADIAAPIRAYGGEKLDKTVLHRCAAAFSIPLVFDTASVHESSLRHFIHTHSTPSGAAHHYRHSSDITPRQSGGPTGLNGIDNTSLLKDTIPFGTTNDRLRSDMGVLLRFVQLTAPWYPSEVVRALFWRIEEATLTVLKRGVTDKETRRTASGADRLGAWLLLDLVMRWALQERQRVLEKEMGLNDAESHHIEDFGVKGWRDTLLTQLLQFLPYAILFCWGTGSTPSHKSSKLSRPGDADAGNAVKSRVIDFLKGRVHGDGTLTDKGMVGALLHSANNGAVIGTDDVSAKEHKKQAKQIAMCYAALLQNWKDRPFPMPHTTAVNGTNGKQSSTPYQKLKHAVRDAFSLQQSRDKHSQFDVKKQLAVFDHYLVPPTTRFLDDIWMFRRSGSATPSQAATMLLCMGWPVFSDSPQSRVSRHRRQSPSHNRSGSASSSSSSYSTRRRSESPNIMHNGARDAQFDNDVNGLDVLQQLVLEEDEDRLYNPQFPQGVKALKAFYQKPLHQPSNKYTVHFPVLPQVVAWVERVAATEDPAAPHGECCIMCDSWNHSTPHCPYRSSRFAGPDSTAAARRLTVAEAASLITRVVGTTVPSLSSLFKQADKLNGEDNKFEEEEKDNAPRDDAYIAEVLDAVVERYSTGATAEADALLDALDVLTQQTSSGAERQALDVLANYQLIPSRMVRFYQEKDHGRSRRRPHLIRTVAAERVMSFLRREHCLYESFRLATAFSTLYYRFAPALHPTIVSKMVDDVNLVKRHRSFLFILGDATLSRNMRNDALDTSDEIDTAKRNDLLWGAVNRLRSVFNRIDHITLVPRGVDPTLVISDGALTSEQAQGSDEHWDMYIARSLLHAHGVGSNMLLPQDARKPQERIDALTRSIKSKADSLHGRARACLRIAATLVSRYSVCGYCHHLGHTRRACVAWLQRELSRSGTVLSTHGRELRLRTVTEVRLHIDRLLVLQQRLQQSKDAIEDEMGRKAVGRQVTELQDIIAVASGRGAEADRRLRRTGRRDLNAQSDRAAAITTAFPEEYGAAVEAIKHRTTLSLAEIRYCPDECVNYVVSMQAAYLADHINVLRRSDFPDVDILGGRFEVDLAGIVDHHRRLAGYPICPTSGNTTMTYHILQPHQVAYFLDPTRQHSITVSGSQMNSGSQGNPPVTVSAIDQALLAQQLAPERLVDLRRFIGSHCFTSTVVGRRDSLYTIMFPVTEEARAYRHELVTRGTSLYRDFLAQRRRIEENHWTTSAPSVSTSVLLQQLLEAELAMMHGLRTTAERAAYTFVAAQEQRMVMQMRLKEYANTRRPLQTPVSALPFPQAPQRQAPAAIQMSGSQGRYIPPPPGVASQLPPPPQLLPPMPPPPPQSYLSQNALSHLQMANYSQEYLSQMYAPPDLSQQPLLPLPPFPGELPQPEVSAPVYRPPSVHSQLSGSRHSATTGGRSSYIRPQLARASAGGSQDGSHSAYHPPSVSQGRTSTHSHFSNAYIAPKRRRDDSEEAEGAE